jgi:hypothetical protein
MFFGQMVRWALVVSVVSVYGSIVAMDNPSDQGNKGQKHELLQDGLEHTQQNKKGSFLNQVLHNPAKALARTNRTHDCFEQCLRDNKLLFDDMTKLEVKQLQTVIKKRYEIWKKLSSECPSLGECTKLDSGDCPLSRLSFPQFREAFEVEAVRILSETITKNHDKPISYLGFGAGGMFQDLVVLTKMLEQNPRVSLFVHLVDPGFFPITEYRKYSGLTKAIDINYKIDNTNALEKLFFCVQKDEKCDHFKNVGVELGIEIMRFKVQDELHRCLEFISFLNRSFPQAKTELFVYSCAREYLDFIKNAGARYADLITAVDIDDEKSVKNGAMKEYLALCKEVLQAYSGANNLCLGKNFGKKPCKGLLQVSLNKKRDDLVMHMYRFENEGI